MSTITPTPGRMIWFQPSPTLGLGEPDANNPLAAVVAAVNPDGTINICAFDRNGNPVPQQNVSVIDPADENTWPEGLVAAGLEEGGWAYWMPYQLAAAAKTETASLTGVGAGGAKDPA